MRGAGRDDRSMLVEDPKRMANPSQPNVGQDLLTVQHPARYARAACISALAASAPK